MLVGLTLGENPLHGTQEESDELALTTTCQASVLQLTEDLARLQDFIRRIRRSRELVKEMLKQRASFEDDHGRDKESLELLADVLWDHHHRFDARTKPKTNPVDGQFVQDADDSLQKVLESIVEESERDRLAHALQPKEIKGEDFVLQCCGQLIDPGKRVGDIISNNEKTVVMLRIAKKGQMIPTTPHVDEATQKALISYWHHKEFDENRKACSEPECMESTWNDPSHLKRTILGLNNIRLG